MYKNISELEEKEKYAFNKIQEFLWFRSDDLKEIINSEWMAYAFLKNWIKEGKVKKYPFHIYSSIDPKKEAPKVNLFEALCQIHETAYLCELTAAQIHKLKIPNDKCLYIASKKRFRERIYDGWQLKYKRSLWSGEVVVEGHLRYTSYTRTVVEIIKDFHKYMTLEELYQFISSVKPIETTKIILILESINNRVLIQKMGWLVDSGLLSVDQIDDLIRYCLQQKSANKLILCEEVKESGIYNDKWKMTVPKDI